MGGELGQEQEWSHEGELDWGLLDDPAHEGVRRWVRDLNGLMADRPALHALDFDPRGFQWVESRDAANSVFAFLRKAPAEGERPSDQVLVVLNATPTPRHNYRVGVPRPGTWRELLNSDAEVYGGSGMGNQGSVETAPVAQHGHFHSLNLTLPPLSVTLFAPDPAADAEGDDEGTAAREPERRPGSAPVARDGERPRELGDVWQEPDRP